MKIVLVVILSGITTLFGLFTSVGAQETKEDALVVTLMAARNAAKGGFIDKAILRYETYLKEKPGDREVGLEFADYLHNCERYQDAEVRYEKLIELLKGEPEGKGDFARKLLLNTARNAVNNKHEDRAVEYYKKALMCGLEDPKVYWELTGLLAKLEKTEEALELCEKVLLADPLNRETLMLKINLLLRLKSVGKKKEAIRILRRLVRVTPKDRELRQRLAVELHNQKKYKEAERHFQLLLKKE